MRLQCLVYKQKFANMRGICEKGMDSVGRRTYYTMLYNRRNGHDQAECMCSNKVMRTVCRACVSNTLTRAFCVPNNVRICAITNTYMNRVYTI